MKRLQRKHPLPVRLSHWLNVPLLAMMIWSGLLIYWANPIYRIGWGHWTLVKMTVSQALYHRLGLDHHLARGMAWHFFFMWLLVGNGLIYVLYTLFSGEWRELLPRRGTLRDALHVVRHDLHLTKRPLPPGKFNGAQRLAYTGIVVMGLGSVLSGLAIYKPVQVGWLTALFGGYQGARFVHFWLTVGYVAFFVVHLAQVVRAGWNNFRAMVIGVEVVEDRPTATSASTARPAAPAPPEVAEEVGA